MISIPGLTIPASATITASQISNSTAAGRSMVTAADAAAQAALVGGPAIDLCVTAFYSGTIALMDLIFLGPDGSAAPTAYRGWSPRRTTNRCRLIIDIKAKSNADGCYFELRDETGIVDGSCPVLTIAGKTVLAEKTHTCNGIDMVTPASLGIRGNKDGAVTGTITVELTLLMWYQP